MKKLAIRQKLLNYILVANNKKINAIFSLFKNEIKTADFILQSAERTVIVNDLTKISWGNYLTQEEMQIISEGREFKK